MPDEIWANTHHQWTTAGIWSMPSARYIRADLYADQARELAGDFRRWLFMTPHERNISETPERVMALLRSIAETKP
jgi:hypothetical protein